MANPFAGGKNAEMYKGPSARKTVKDEAAIASRVDFSDEKMGPKFKSKVKPKSDAKPKAVKVTEKETSIETPTGEIGSVDHTADVIGPDMGRVTKSDPVEMKEADVSEASFKPKARGDWEDPHRQAQKMMGFKSGGKVSSASRRADGCAIRGKTRA